MNQNPTEQILHLLQPDWEAYRSLLLEALSSENRMLNRINAYLTENAGKQIRPMLALLAANALNAENPAGPETEKRMTRARVCAAVSELIHTATLLHDDVADDSDLRRGKPTVKALFSPTASVLMGDFWLARGLKLITRYECGDEPLQAFAQALDELADGEMLQMTCAEELSTDEDTYYAIILRKTASLFIATLQSVCSVLQADALRSRSLVRFARYLGLSFQIRDDIFDYSPDLKTGKAGGADILERKLTLPLLGAMRNAVSTEAGLTEKNNLMELIRTIEPGHPEDAGYRKIQDTVLAFVRRYRGIEYAEDALQQCLKNARETLETIGGSVYRDALLQLTDYMGYRTR